MSSEDRKIPWERGQRLLCISLDHEFTDYTRKEVNIGEIYNFSCLESNFCGMEALSFLGKGFIHPLKNFISWPDLIEETK